MKSKSKIILLLLAVMALCLAMAGCGGEDTAAEPEADGNTLVYGSGDYTAINPALYEHGEINLLLFAGLTSHDGEDQVVPTYYDEQV